MKIDVDLEAAAAHVEAADVLLAATPSADTVHRAVVDLDAADGLLAALVSDVFLDPADAATLSRVRGDLSGHVLAARAMQDVNLPLGRQAATLHRGTALARTQLSSLRR